MPLDIKTSIKWALYVSSSESKKPKKLYFEQPLFHTHEDFEDDGLLLLDYLQEVFYVSKLGNLYEAKKILDGKEILDRRDDAWDILIGAFEPIFRKISQIKDILENDSSYAHPDELFKLKGIAYVKYINSTMGGIYPIRYEIYKLLKPIIPLSPHKDNNARRCTDIVCNGKVFEKFFNLSMRWFENAQRKIQSPDYKDVERILTYLSRRNGFAQFRKKIFGRWSWMFLNHTCV